MNLECLYVQPVLNGVTVSDAGHGLPRRGNGRG